MSEKQLKLEIYLPAECNLLDKFQREILIKLTKVFGGTTIIPNCLGTWKNQNEIEYDAITIIRIYTTLTWFKECAITFYSSIEDIKKHYKQSSIAFTINDAMEFY